MYILKILSAINRNRKKLFRSKFIRREKYEALQGQFDILMDTICSPENKLTRKAILNVITEPQRGTGDELCLFLSYSKTPKIKPHVKYHLEALLERGIPVILIINSDLPDEPLEISPDLKSKLSGLIIRENIGYDFAGWSQTLSQLTDIHSLQRLYLINDSMVGPLNDDLFIKMIEKFRKSGADLVGLTSNQEPIPHIQSFVLAIGNRLLNDQNFLCFFKGILSFPSKELVIAAYETRMTRLIGELGYKTEALYDPPFNWINKADKTAHHFDELYDQGFPYIKVSALKKERAHDFLARRIAPNNPVLQHLPE